MNVNYLLLVLSTVLQTGVSWAPVSLESSTMIQFILLENWHIGLLGLLGILARSSNMKISGGFSFFTFLFLLMKTKHSVHIMMFAVVTSIDLLTWPKSQYDENLYLSIYLSIVSRGGSTDIDQDGSCWKTLHLATGLHCTTQAGEASLGCEKIFAATSFLISGCLTPLIYYG